MKTLLSRIGFTAVCLTLPVAAALAHHSFQASYDVVVRAKILGLSDEDIEYLGYAPVLLSDYSERRNISEEEIWGLISRNKIKSLNHQGIIWVEDISL